MLLGLKFVQLQKNQSLHSVLGFSPFKAVYGQEPARMLQLNVVPEKLKHLYQFSNATQMDDVLPHENEENVEDDTDDFDESEDEFLDANANDDFDAELDEAFKGSLAYKDNISNNFKAVCTKRCSISSSDDSIEIGVLNKVHNTRFQKFKILPKAIDSVDKNSNHSMDQHQSKNCTETDQSEEKDDSSNEQFDDQNDGLYSKISGSSDDETILQESNNQENICCSCKGMADGAHTCSVCEKNVHAFCGKGNDEDEGNGCKITCLNCLKNDNFEKLKQQIRRSTQKQADKMIKQTQKRLPLVKTGDNVMIPIPTVDRPQCEFKNVVAIVMDEEENGFSLACRAGWIKERFTRGEFTKCKEKFITNEDVPKQLLSFRTAIGKSSITGRQQGYFHCNCKKGCSSGKCKCRKEDLKCNSRCHNSDSCKNK